MLEGVRRVYKIQRLIRKRQHRLVSEPERYCVFKNFVSKASIKVDPIIYIKTSSSDVHASYFIPLYLCVLLALIDYMNQGQTGTRLPWSKRSPGIKTSDLATDIAVKRRQGVKGKEVYMLCVTIYLQCFDLGIEYQNIRRFYRAELISLRLQPSYVKSFLSTIFAPGRENQESAHAEIRSAEMP